MIREEPERQTGPSAILYEDGFKEIDVIPTTCGVPSQLGDGL
jgi:hypothetical protein